MGGISYAIMFPTEGQIDSVSTTKKISTFSVRNTSKLYERNANRFNMEIWVWAMGMEIYKTFLISLNFISFCQRSCCFAEGEIITEVFLASTEGKWKPSQLFYIESNS